MRRRTTLMVIILGCSLIERLREEMIIIIQKPFGQLLLHLVEGSVVVQVVGGCNWAASNRRSGAGSNLLGPINFIKHIIAAAGNLNYEEGTLWTLEEMEMEHTELFNCAALNWEGSNDSFLCTPPAVGWMNEWSVNLFDGHEIS